MIRNKLNGYSDQIFDLVLIFNVRMTTVLRKFFSCVSSKYRSNSDDAPEDAEDTKARSKQIEKDLARDKKKYKSTYRLLLLGNFKS